ncbi:hypothetical protein OIU84_002585 [Salix udensis]|uniref:Uncharacterized protein n=1 Tax=Salix udensis TaxID=889485 RepID=A0AAD6P5H7_9ROSI|nr:hypothetical protein OIU84_002585 [Salix udensis]
MAFSPSVGNCSFCVNSSIQALIAACPNQKEAISMVTSPPSPPFIVSAPPPTSITITKEEELQFERLKKKICNLEKLKKKSCDSSSTVKGNTEKEGETNPKGVDGHTNYLRTIRTSCYSMIYKVKPTQKE